MFAKDIMTTDVVSVAPATSVREIAELLLAHQISAVPVTAPDGRVLGVVGERDLMRRVEQGAEVHRAWWLELFRDYQDSAKDFVRSHGTEAGDVMSGDFLTVDEETPVAEIARLLEERGVKRAIVARDGIMSGIVARADLVRVLATRKPNFLPTSIEADRAIRDKIIERLKRKELAVLSYVSVIVSEGVAHLWGLVETKDQRRAIEIAASEVSGVRSVANHLKCVAFQAWA